MPTAGEDEADGASTSEIMDMIEELVEEAGTSDQSVSLYHPHASPSKSVVPSETLTCLYVP